MLSLTTALAALTLGAAAAPPQGVNAYLAKLVKVGATIPDVSVTHPGGKTVKLLGLFKGKKAGLINFWFYQ